jgi:1-acyl-sn-glycerol-3-phosphate acyltransferase
MSHQLAQTMPQTFVQRLVQWLTTLAGWRIHIQEPLPARCVIIGAPHTTNWDLLAALTLRGATGYHFRWIAKDTVFWGPVGWFLRKLGGIPVNRRSRNNFVDQMAELFAQEKELLLAIAPQGTRSVQTHWRSGFYYMAQAANVPIALGYADYVKKVIGIGPLFHPTGDLQVDFDYIREFYTGIMGRHPHLNGEIRLKPKS